MDNVYSNAVMMTEKSVSTYHCLGLFSDGWDRQNTVQSTIHVWDDLKMYKHYTQYDMLM